jgi:hypothetical protein
LLNPLLLEWRQFGEGVSWVQMDKALLLVLGAVGVVVTLIPDNKDPVAPVVPRQAMAPQETELAPEQSNAMAETKTLDTVPVQPRSQAALEESDSDTFAASVERQFPLATSPAAGRDERRAQSLGDEAAYQAQHRGS